MRWQHLTAVEHPSSGYAGEKNRIFASQFNRNDEIYHREIL